jgi:hypothetical protein
VNFYSIDWEKVVRVFSALLTPVIALLASYIAWRQHMTNRRQFRLALFEKRWAVFKSTATLIAAVLQSAQVQLSEINAFDIGTSDQEFLFGADIVEYLSQIRHQAVNLLGLGNDVQRSPERTALVQWFGGQMDETKKKFGKYMAFKEAN